MEGVTGSSPVTPTSLRRSAAEAKAATPKRRPRREGGRISGLRLGMPALATGQEGCHAEATSAARRRAHRRATAWHASASDGDKKAATPKRRPRREGGRIAGLRLGMPALATGQEGCHAEATSAARRRAHRRAPAWHASASDGTRRLPRRSDVRGAKAGASQGSGLACQR